MKVMEEGWGYRKQEKDEKIETNSEIEAGFWERQISMATQPSRPAVRRCVCICVLPPTNLSIMQQLWYVVVICIQ